MCKLSHPLTTPLRSKVFFVSAWLTASSESTVSHRTISYCLVSYFYVLTILNSKPRRMMSCDLKLSQLKHNTALNTNQNDDILMYWLYHPESCGIVMPILLLPAPIIFPNSIPPTPISSLRNSAGVSLSGIYKRYKRQDWEKFCHYTMSHST